MTNDREIIKKINAGDTAAFELIIEDYKRLVYNIVFRMVQNTRDVEDLCQDVFVKVFRNLASFHFQSKLSTWIGTIAYNTTINYLKKKPTQLKDDVGEENSYEYAISGENNPQENTEMGDLSHRLKIEIDTLPIQFRTILSLFHLEEMSYLEIGEITKLPEGTVKSHLFRARKLLKERLLMKYQKEELFQ